MKILKIDPKVPGDPKVLTGSWDDSMAAMLVAKDNAKLLKDYARKKGVALDIEPLLAVGIDSYFNHTLWTTWASKQGLIPSFHGSAETKTQAENQGFVIREFEKQNFVVCGNPILAMSGDSDWMTASIDAVVPQSSDPRAAADYGFPLLARSPDFPSRKKMWNAVQSGSAPITGDMPLWCQLQHQLYVTEAPYGWFAAMGVEVDKATGNKVSKFPFVQPVTRDDCFLKAYVAAARFYFSEFIWNSVEPPKLTSDKELIDLLAEKAVLDQALEAGDNATAAELYFKAVADEQKATAIRKELESRLIQEARVLNSNELGTVMFTPSLEISFTKTSNVSWEKVATTLSKKLGNAQIPEDVITACQTRQKESVKVKRV